MEQKTYTGWKIGLLVIFAVVLLISAMNLLGEALRDDRPRQPPPTVVTVSPS